ncbi:MAG: DoxX family membrane protein [Fimbriimonadaceae bacterium]|nr:DoxX family membrane protein [Fimbriimonadaceae bacterium]
MSLITNSAVTRAFDSFDVRLTRWLAHHGISLLRVSVAVIYLWFGFLKFFPGMSPAQDLAARTIGALSLGMVTPTVAVFLLALLETAIGLGLLFGRRLRIVLLLMLLQMAGTITPMLLFPGETFTWAPFAPTLEGQYIIKNLVLVCAALVIGATVRGGHLVADPEDGVRSPRQT